MGLLCAVYEGWHGFAEGCKDLVWSRSFHPDYLFPRLGAHHEADLRLSQTQDLCHVPGDGGVGLAIPRSRMDGHVQLAICTADGRVLCMVQGGGRLEVDESMRPEASLRNQSGWQSTKHCCCGICHLHTPSEMLPTQHVNQPQNKPHLGVGLDVQCQGAHARTDESQIRW